MQKGFVCLACENGLELIYERIRKMCEIKIKSGALTFSFDEGYLDVEYPGGAWEGWQTGYLDVTDTKALYEKMKEFYEGGKE